jgi:thiol-disulfide isomerase/thioredoxin
MYGSSLKSSPVETPGPRRRRLLASAVAALAGAGLARAALAQGEAGTRPSGAGLAGVPAGTAGPKPGEAIAWPEVPLLDGTRLPAGRWSGQAAVVVFWATTCPFCRNHNEHVQKLHLAAQAARAAGKPAPHLLTVARDRDEAAVRRYVQARGYGFPVTLAYPALAAALSPRNIIPLTVTVDARGRLRQAFGGEMFEEDILELMALAAA